jgi:HTH-type transcriptional regulator/antitoxin HigA
MRTQPRTRGKVMRFADEVQLHPGVIVGMLQHARVLPFSHLNDLKVRFEWAHEAKSS